MLFAESMRVRFLPFLMADPWVITYFHVISFRSCLQKVLEHVSMSQQSYFGP